MQDLSSVMFYNTKFRIRRCDSDIDMLWLIVRHVQTWMVKKHNSSLKKCIPDELRKWSAFRKGSTIQSLTHFPYEDEIQLVSDYYKKHNESGSMEYWACAITEKFVPIAPFAPRVWTTELGFEQINADEAEITCVISYSDRAGHIGPIEKKPIPTIPRIIRHILNDKRFECCCSIDRPNDKAQAVPVGQWSDIWNRLLNLERELPYIIINPTHSEEQPFGVDIQKLAYALCGNALVFYPDSEESAHDLLNTFPRNYICDTGNIRCYVPNCNPSKEKDSYRHRYLNPCDIELNGSDGIIEIFRRAIVQNIDKYAVFFRIDSVKRVRERQNREDALQNLHMKYQEYLKEQKAILVKTTEELLEDAIKRQEELESEREEALLLSCTIEDQLNQQKVQNYALSAQIESMRSDAEKGRSMAKTEAARSVCKKMENCDDVVLYFENAYSDRLFFTDNAKKSLKTCTLSVSELWHWLHSLAEYMYVLFDESEAGIDKQFKNLTGIECGRGEGSQTRKDKKLMKQFFTDYEGESINVEMHLKSKDRLQALHFGFSREKKKLIIDHCGEHLTNSLTRGR